MPTRAPHAGAKRTVMRPIQRWRVWRTVDGERRLVAVAWTRQKAARQAAKIAQREGEAALILSEPDGREFDIHVDELGGILVTRRPEI